MDNEIDTIETNKEPAIWGFWASFGFAIPVALLFFLSQIFVTVAFVIVNKLIDPSINPESLESNGVLISFCVIISGILSSCVLLLFAFLKKGTKVKDYFRLYPIPMKHLFLWLGIMVLVILGLDIIAYFHKGQIVPDVMYKHYETVGYFLPFMLFAFIIAAPVFEELFFRGFIFEPIRNTKLGNIGAIAITSLLWSVIHLQYDFFGIAIIFVLGVLLGIAKIKTKSLYVTIIMHSAMNVIATSECIIIYEFLK